MILREKKNCHWETQLQFNVLRKYEYTVRKPIKLLPMALILHHHDSILSTRTHTFESSLVKTVCIRLPVMCMKNNKYKRTWWKERENAKHWQYFYLQKQWCFISLQIAMRYEFPEHLKSENTEDVSNAI